jgi:hypothetical protein
MMGAPDEGRHRHSNAQIRVRHAHNPAALVRLTLNRSRFR